MEPGDVYLTVLDPVVGHEQAKTRPCVILSRTELNQNLGTVIIAPITSWLPQKPYPNVVSFLANDANLPKAGSIKLEQVRCVDKSRLRKFVGKFDEKKVVQLRAALVCVFDL